MKLNINEIARCFNLPVNTLERWIRQGRIPVVASGTNGVFDVNILKKWAASKKLPFSLPTTSPAQEQTNEGSEALLTAVVRGGLHSGLSGTSVIEVLESATGCVPGFSEPERARFLEALMERERLTSTGMGKGVAIPHSRTPLSGALEKPMIVTCFPRAPIDFNAIDDQPVFVLFLLLSTSVKVHLNLLSRLAFCVRDNEFVSFLKSAPSADRFFSKIADFESRLEKSETL